jgi:hypothetical protein
MNAVYLYALFDPHLEESKGLVQASGKHQRSIRFRAGVKVNCLYHGSAGIALVGIGAAHHVQKVGWESLRRLSQEWSDECIIRSRDFFLFLLVDVRPIRPSRLVHGCRVAFPETIGKIRAAEGRSSYFIT